VREDPFRVHFPVFDCSSITATRRFSELTKIRQLSAGVHEVSVGNGKNRYVYKEVDNPLYEPRDSQVLNQELQNLQLFHGTKGVVQLVAAVVSRNPYHTFSETCEAYEAYDSDQSEQSNETDQSDQNPKTTPSTVLRGVLLEYHPNGTLADALQGAQEVTQLAGTWRRWALQIAAALSRVHEQQVTHMDLKPSNVLISTEMNAVLSDVSGIGGVTRDYLAPEMLNIPDPLAESMESRVWNDIWALGKMFMEMGDASSNNIEKEQLKRIARDATAEDPTLRPSLHNIVSFLSNH
jgi:serine/threonine protein kinase